MIVFSPFRIVLCFLLLAVAVAPLWSQSTIKIEGRVLDAENGQPLVGANIQIRGTGFGASTDAQGRFELEDLLVGDYTLVASFIGYAMQNIPHVRVQFDQPAHVDFNLHPQVLQMPVIRVTADQPLTGREPAQVVNAEQIRRSTAETVSDVLQTLSGVTVERSGSGGADATLSIRGSKSNQVLVLIDGVPLSDPLTGTADLSAIPLSAVERIEVHKGGQSDQYGSGALAGVIHILTRQANENSVDLKTQIGSYANRRGGLVLQRRWTDWNLLLSGEYGTAAGDYAYSFVHAGVQQHADRLNADRREQSLFAKLGWEPNAFKAQLSAQWSGSDRGLPGQVFALTPYAHAGMSRALLQLHLRKPLHNGNVEGLLAWRQENSTFDNRYDRFAVPLEYRSVPPYWNENDLQQGSAEIKSYRRVGQRIGVRIGSSADRLEFSDTDHLAPGSAPVGNARLRRLGLWMQFEWLMLQNRFGVDRFEINASARQEWAETDQVQLQTTRRDRQTSPTFRFMLQKQLGLEWQLALQTGRSFRLPTFSDLFFEQFRVRGNPQLLPEKMDNRQIDLVAAWTGALRGKLRWAGFDNRIDDLIVWRMGNFATFSPMNTDARLRGQEIELNLADRSERQSLSTSYLFLNSENLSNKRTVIGKALPYRAEHSAKVSARLSISRVDFAYDWRWVGERFVTEANTVRMDAYQMHDITVAVPLQSSRLQSTVRLSLLNLLDTPVSMFENAPLPGREWRLSVDCGWR